MNTFNRVIMVILMLIILIFSIVAVVNIFTDLFEWPTVTNSVINSIHSLNPAISATIFIVITIISLIILIFEFRKRRSR